MTNTPQGVTPGRRSRARRLAFFLAVTASMFVVRPLLANDDEVCRPAAPLPHSDCRRDAQCCEGLVCQVGVCRPGCRIGGFFYAGGTANPANACQACQPRVSTTRWSKLANGTVCNDNNACTTHDTCGNGSCVGGPPLNCNDSNVCTSDVCRPATGCFHANNTATCDDDNPNTTGDVCAGGICAGVDRCAGVVCAAHDPCHVAGTCNPATGQCSNPVASDGTACNADSNGCTQNDSCRSGTCTAGTPPICDDGLSCTTDTCQSAGNNSYTCASTIDANTCLIDGACIPENAANPANQCQQCASSVSQTGYSDKPVGTACSDGDACTENDTCENGACVGGNPPGPGTACATDADCCQGLVCGEGTCTPRDDIPPAAPVFHGIDAAGPTVKGSAEANALVSLFTTAGCAGSAIVAGNRADAAGGFAIVIPAPASTTTYYGTATDAAGNVSPCSPRGITFATIHAECPDVAPNLPVSRAPIPWKNDPYNDLLQSQIFPADFAEYLSELAQDRPVLVGPNSWTGTVPFNWKVGTEIGVSAGGQAQPFDVYGDWTEASPNDVINAGQASPGVLSQRLAAHQQYVQSYAGIAKPSVYLDFGTQLFGNRGSCNGGGAGCTGFWDFYWNHWNDYTSAGFDLGPKPPDPSTWLRRSYDGSVQNPCWCCRPNSTTGVCDQSCDPACVADLAGLSFPSSPIDPTYSPYRRYALNLTSEGWAAWMKQVMRWTARDGYNLAFIDNVYFANCWNAECQEGYQAWLAVRYTQPEIDRYFKVSTSLLPDGSFESDWFPNQNGGGDFRTYYSYVVDTGHLYPDIDSVGGVYSARFEGPGTLGLYGSSTSPTATGDDFDFTIHYRTDPGIDGQLTLYGMGTTTPTIVTPLPASATWTSKVVRFHIDPGYNVTPLIDSPGRIWLDEVWLSNVVVVNGVEQPNPYPTFDSSLPGGPQGVDLVNFSGRTRTMAAQAYWDSVVDVALPYLKASAQAIPEGAGFQVFANSNVQRRGADYFMVEGNALEFEYGRQDTGYAPGLYQANPAILLGSAHLTTDVVGTNVFDYKYTYARRYTDAFAYHMHQAVAPPPELAHNIDSAFLLHAESAAFGGGAGVDLEDRAFYYYPSYIAPGVEHDRLRAVGRNFLGFVGQHPELFACLASYADLGVVIRDQPGRPEQGELYDLANGLAANGVLWDAITERTLSAATLTRFKAVLLHKVDRLSEADAAALIAFMQAGGTVIEGGGLPAFDELVRLRAANPASIWPPTAATAAPGHFVLQTSSATVSDVMASLSAHVRPSPGVFPGRTATSLRAAAWTGYDRMVVHLVNFAVPVGQAKDGQVAAQSLDVAVPLPPGVTPTTVVVYDPETSPPTVTQPSFTVSGGVVSFTLPAFHIYSIVAIQ